MAKIPVSAGIINDVVSSPYLFFGNDPVETGAFYIRSVFFGDLDGDKSNEALVSFVSYPDFSSFPVQIIDSIDGNPVLVTDSLFRGPVSSPQNSEQMVFSDLNGDNFKDLVFSDTGMDKFPWSGASIKVALGGQNGYTNIESVEFYTKGKLQDPTRNYGVAAGDFNGDGKKEIFLGAQEEYVENVTKIIQINEVGSVYNIGVVPGWTDVRYRLPSHCWMQAADFNNDGYDDLLLSGSGTGANNTILYGSMQGLNAANRLVLPEGPFGQGAFNYYSINLPMIWPPTVAMRSAETKSISADFNNDGFIDIFSTQQQADILPPKAIKDKSYFGYEDVYENGGHFYDKSAYFSILNSDSGEFYYKDGGQISAVRRHYDKLMSFDLNGDGFLDVVGQYFTFPSRLSSEAQTLFGTTFFVNDGSGNFKSIDGLEVFSQLAVYPWETSGYTLLEPTAGAIIPLSLENDLLSALQITPTRNGHYWRVAAFTTSQASKISNDIKYGTSADDTIYASDIGGSIKGAGGDDRIYGDVGIDLLIYSMSAKNYELSVGRASVDVRDRTDLDGKDTAYFVEKIVFPDFTLDLASVQKTASLSKSQIDGLVELYIASFNRAPDAMGLHYWGGRLTDGMGLDAIAKSFFVQPETVAKYPVSMANETFVTTVYGNILGRVPDSDGFRYWIDELANGHVTRDNFLLAILNGAHANPNAIDDVATLANKVAVGEHFAMAQGLSNVEWSQQVMAGVTYQASTVSAANSLTDSFAALADLPDSSELVVKILGFVE